MEEHRSPLCDPAEDESRDSELRGIAERELVVAVEAGDREASRRLVRMFLPEIGALSARYGSVMGLERAELIDEGVVGLLRAARRYDARLHVPFWAYASWWVRQAMQRLVAERTGPVVLSDRAVRQLAAIKAARQAYLSLHAREPTARELAVATGLTPDHVNGLWAGGRASLALEEITLVDDRASTLGHALADPASEHEYERVLDRMEIERVRDLTSVLDERERVVVARRFGLGEEPQTLEAIGAHLGLSAERVRQLERAALLKLRDAAGRPPTVEPTTI